MICFSCISDELNVGRTPKYDKIVIDLNDVIYQGIADNTTKPTLMLWNDNGPVLTEQTNQPNLITANLPPMGKYNMMVVTNIENVSLVSTNDYNTIAAQYTAPNQTNPKLDKFYAKSMGTLIVNDNHTQFFENELDLYNRRINVIVTLENASTIIESANFAISGLSETITLNGKILNSDNVNQPLNYNLNVAENIMKNSFNMFGTYGTTQNIVFSLKAKNEDTVNLTCELSATLDNILTLNPRNTTININVQMFAEIINNKYVFSLHEMSMNDDEYIDSEI